MNVDRAMLRPLAAKRADKEFVPICCLCGCVYGSITRSLLLQCFTSAVRISIEVIKILCILYYFF
jgi:hypothetical protein